MVSSLNCVARRQSASVAGDSCAPSLMGAVCLWELDSFTAKASWHQSVVRKTAVCGHRDPAQVFRNGRKTCAASQYNITGLYSITTGLCFFFFFFYFIFFFPDQLIYYYRWNWDPLHISVQQPTTVWCWTIHMMPLSLEILDLNLGWWKFLHSFIWLVNLKSMLFEMGTPLYYLYTLYSATSCPKT